MCVRIRGCAYVCVCLVTQSYVIQDTNDWHDFGALHRRYWKTVGKLRVPVSPLFVVVGQEQILKIRPKRRVQHFKFITTCWVDDTEVLHSLRSGRETKWTFRPRSFVTPIYSQSVVSEHICQVYVRGWGFKFYRPEQQETFCQGNTFQREDPVVFVSDVREGSRKPLLKQVSVCKRTQPKVETRCRRNIPLSRTTLRLWCPGTKNERPFTLY